MARTEAEKAAQKRYQSKQDVRSRLKIIALKFHVVHDKDILNQLNCVDNVSGYIKNLIREDIKKGE